MEQPSAAVKSAVMLHALRYSVAHDQPMPAREWRFWTLRESGYKGWIDQDGYAVEGEGF